jgi:hypothetical protein
MAIVTCLECNNEISTSALVCPHCGAPANQALGISEKEKSGKNFLLFSIILVLLTLFGILYDHEYITPAFNALLSFLIIGIFVVIIVMNKKNIRK